MDRTARLRQIMLDEGLSPADVARLTGVRPDTVYGWRTSGSPYVIPAHRLEILELKLAAHRALGGVTP